MTNMCMPNTFTCRFKVLLPCVKNKLAKVPKFQQYEYEETAPTWHNIIKQCAFIWALRI